MNPHPLLRVNAETLAAVLADMIEAGESETFSSDDAENRPDPDTARMIASRMNLYPQVKAELQRRTPEPEPGRYVIAVGNPVEGHEFIGPFPDFESAHDHAEGWDEYWIITLTRPHDD